MTILITGAAGFIGAATAERLLELGERVRGIDNLNDYYDVNLKLARLKRLEAFPEFGFAKTDVADHDAVKALFEETRFDVVFHAAAQAGVRGSLKRFDAYVQSNLAGFANVLEACRENAVKHLVFASSSSVYGANKEVPFSEHHGTDHPLSLYAATKKANELLAHSYAHLYRLPCTGLRFFTVYGPRGRPDMALFRFTEAMLAGRAIDVFNHGDMQRDFTYIDDVVAGVVKIIARVAQPGELAADGPLDPANSDAPYRLYNIGNHHPEQLTDLIAYLEEALGVKATMNMLPMQPGDVPATFADVADLGKDVGFKPATPLREGVRRFVAWYREFYGV